MIFSKTKLRDAVVIELEKLDDDRGFFARSWCKKEFEAHSLNFQMAQSNIGFSKRKGTLRGMHYQLAPYEEAKLVRCTVGAIYDVIVDLRPDSPTHKRWIGEELTAENHKMLYIPEGFAHGYQTLVDNTEISYLTSQSYVPEAARGVRYDDPAFRIRWPLEVEVISEADKSWTHYSL